VPSQHAVVRLVSEPLVARPGCRLSGVKIGQDNTKVAIAAYADDVTVFLTSPVDSQKLHDILSTYEAASGAKVNRQKSKALALGHWDGSSLISNIPYSQTVKILGFKFTNKVNVAANMSWSIVLSRVRSASRETYYRDLNLAMRIKFVHVFLLARIWYVAQVFPPPADHIRQINTSIAWFIWRGDIFRVPLSTLQRGRSGGGWDLIHVWSKCRALFLIRLYVQSGFDDSFTASLLRKWDIQPGSANPTFYARIPAIMGYLRSFIADDAYIPMRGVTEGDKSYKKRLYPTLKQLSNNVAPPQEMRIVKKWPTINWKAVWRNLVETPSR